MQDLPRRWARNEILKKVGATQASPTETEGERGDQDRGCGAFQHAHPLNSHTTMRRRSAPVDIVSAITTAASRCESAAAAGAAASAAAIAARNWAADAARVAQTEAAHWLPQVLESKTVPLDVCLAEVRDIASWAVQQVRCRAAAAAAAGAAAVAGAGNAPMRSPCHAACLSRAQ